MGVMETPYIWPFFSWFFRGFLPPYGFGLKKPLSLQERPPPPELPQVCFSEHFFLVEKDTKSQGYERTLKTNSSLAFSKMMVGR